MGFFGGLFTGNNNTLNNDINSTGGIGEFGTAVGEGDVNAASGFYNTLLGGNEKAEAKLLAPEISTMQQQGQQQLQTASQFANRSGGTNAAAQENGDKTRANVDDMISKLTGQAAGGLANIGTTEQGLGLSADEEQAQLAQERQQNQQQSIFGGILGGLGGLAGKGITGGLGMIPGLSEIF